MMPTDSRDARPLAAALATALAVALAGCGELETPDLAHGNVAGRLVGGVDALAEIYPLGRPDLVVRPDGEGQFELEGLPAGDVTLVVYDGGLRAEQSVVRVRGAERARRTWYGGDATVPDAQKIALGGKVVAAVLPVGGGVAVAPRVTAVGTTRRGVAGTAGTVVVGVLPAGDYQLTAELEGYGPATTDITVAPGTSVHEVSVSPAPGAAAIGCAASGGRCRNDLFCDVTDGNCYQCLTDAQCTGGASCDPVARFCAASPGGGSGAVCSVCTGDAQCAGGADAVCHKPAGAAAADPGYCTLRASTPTPPAGFLLAGDPGQERWVALLGCAEFFEELGETCFRDETCSAGDGIVGGFCYRPGGSEPSETGACTTGCASDLECVVPGFACREAPSLGRSVCLRPAG